MIAVTHDLNEPASLSPAAFGRLARFITGELGIKMPEAKLTMVQSRLLRRVRELGLRSVDQYAEYFFASSHPEEREELINSITTNKTDFFREPEHFAYLNKVILPEMFSVGKKSRRFHVWSAGCSSGEEPYTLAMVLSEFAIRQPGFDFAILATDVSTRVLRHAHAGIYDEDQTQPVSAELRRKYLRRSRNGNRTLVRPIPELRGKISFHQLNFMDAEYGIRDLFDAVFFRNVMIYFDRDTQECVVNRIAAHLVPGGYFFAGHSESMVGLNVPLKAVQASVYRKVL